MLLLPYILLNFAVYAVTFWHGDCDFFLSFPVRLDHILPLYRCGKTPPRFPPQHFWASWAAHLLMSSLVGIFLYGLLVMLLRLFFPLLSPFIWGAKNKNKNSDSFQVLIHRNLALSCSATFFQVLSLGHLHPSDPLRSFSK